MVDIDGNVYPTASIDRPSIPVTSNNSSIGQQVWTLQNLNVSRYQNGDVIPQVTDQAQWEQITTGAWCYYDNDPANGPVYGKLYNWYAVNDPRGLAPAGYHVASDSEFTTLVNFLGGQSVAGGKIKANSALWATPNAGVTANSLFLALPAGYRLADSGPFEFQTSGQSTYWWTGTTVPGENYAWTRIVQYSQTNVIRGALGKRQGFSVRCVKD